MIFNSFTAGSNYCWYAGRLRKATQSNFSKKFTKFWYFVNISRLPSISATLVITNLIVTKQSLVTVLFHLLHSYYFKVEDVKYQWYFDLLKWPETQQPRGLPWHKLGSERVKFTRSPCNIKGIIADKISRKMKPMTAFKSTVLKLHIF